MFLCTFLDTFSPIEVYTKQIKKNIIPITRIFFQNISFQSRFLSLLLIYYMNDVQIKKKNIESNSVLE